MTEPISRRLIRSIRAGGVIPAHPLALSRARRLDERRQRALTRYYLDAGAAGLAIGVHTTQFAIRRVGLYRPVLELALETIAGWTRRPVIRVAGVVGPTPQALREATLANDLGYDLALVSLAGHGGASDRALVDHVRRVAEVIPVMGFYLQPAVGGRDLSYDFWRRLAELERVVAIKVAPFDRYRTVDVMRAVADAGRFDLALYTGNDDAIVADLVTRYRGPTSRRPIEFVGGLLGQWAVWTRAAVRLERQCRAARRTGRIPRSLLERGQALTAANAAIFDARNRFRGSIAGIHEVLRRQGLLAGVWCLEDHERLSPGQSAAIDRIARAHPELTDDEFVAQNRDRWLE